MSIEQSASKSTGQSGSAFIISVMASAPNSLASMPTYGHKNLAISSSMIVSVIWQQLDTPWTSAHSPRSVHEFISQVAGSHSPSSLSVSLSSLLWTSSPSSSRVSTTSKQ